MKIINLIIILFAFCVMANNESFSYDSLNRLTQTTYSNGTVESFTYDILGNRTSHVVTVPTPQFQVAISSGSNGMVTPNGTMTIPQGGFVNVTAASSTGYHFVNWTVSSGITIVDNDSTGSFTINGNGTIQANFSINNYTVTINKTGSGAVSPSGNATANYGSDLAISATPDAGYHFVNWTTTGGIIIENASAASTRIQNVTASGAVTANFSVTAYTITVNKTGNGSVTPLGDNTVYYGSDLPISATPDAGYHFNNWTASSGVTIENSSLVSTKVKNITTSGTATANFSMNQYTITVSTYGNGGTTPSGDVIANFGASLAVQAIADAGFHFIRWDVTGGLSIANPNNATSTINNISSNGNIKALFNRDTLPGSISVDSIDSHTGVYVYATNSWIGKKILDGPGTINSLKPGIYRVCFVNDSKRRLYKTVTVNEDANTLVHASMGDALPLIFTAKEQLLDNNSSPIRMNSPGSAVMDDIDVDGTSELVCASQTGAVTIYKNSGGFSINKTFSLPLTGSEVVKCIRIADIDYDKIPDLIVGLNTGRIFIADFNGSVKSTLFTAAAGLTGFDFIEMNNDGYPDILLGSSDGTIKIAQSTGNLTWSSPIAVNTSVISNASPLTMNLGGNGKLDIMCGNGSGDVNWFSDAGSFAFSAKGPVNSGGMPLKSSPNISLSAGYSDGLSLPIVIMTDGAGNIYKAQAVISGDIGNDGLVDILDLQQMGMHWGMIDSDLLWDGKINLNLTPLSGTTQIIDILDLQVLGKNWGLQR
jgi:YD repeat-containing protein